MLLMVWSLDFPFVNCIVYCARQKF
jgi:hypothetical protein